MVTIENSIYDAASTRDRILQATLSIIGKEGFQHITIKKIADLAEVNIAAVNYYFGSKNNLINEAMKELSKRFIKCFEILDDKMLPPYDRVKEFLLAYIDSALEYPDVFRSFIDSVINNDGKCNIYLEFIKKEGIEKVKTTLKEAGVPADKDILAMKMVQMISGLEFPILLRRQVKFLVGIDYNKNEIKEKYAEMVLKALFS